MSPRSLILFLLSLFFLLVTHLSLSLSLSSLCLSFFLSSSLSHSVSLLLRLSVCLSVCLCPSAVMHVCRYVVYRLPQREEGFGRQDLRRAVHGDRLLHGARHQGETETETHRQTHRQTDTSIHWYYIHTHSSLTHHRSSSLFLSVQ